MLIEDIKAQIELASEAVGEFVLRAPANVMDLIAEVEQAQRRYATLRDQYTTLQYQVDDLEKEREKMLGPDPDLLKKLYCSLCLAPSGYRIPSGNALWLNALTDEEWNTLWTEIIPPVLKEASQREVKPIWPYCKKRL